MRVLVLALGVLFVAACSGGSPGVVSMPGGTGTPAGEALWVVGNGVALVYDVSRITSQAALSLIQELDGITDRASGGLPYNVADAKVAPDGRLYVLENDGGAANWQLRVYPPNAHGRQGPERVIAGQGYADRVLLASHAIAVTVDDAKVEFRGSMMLFAYGATASSAPTNVVPIDGSPFRAVEGSDGTLYVEASRPTGPVINAYADNGTALPQPVPDRFEFMGDLAFDRGGSLWTYWDVEYGGYVRLPTKSAIFRLNPGNFGPQADQRIDIGALANALTLDALGRIFVDVGSRDLGSTQAVRVYDPTTSAVIATIPLPQSVTGDPTGNVFFPRLSIGPLPPG